MSPLSPLELSPPKKSSRLTSPSSWLSVALDSDESLKKLSKSTSPSGMSALTSGMSGTDSVGSGSATGLSSAVPAIKSSSSRLSSEEGLSAGFSAGVSSANISVVSSADALSLSSRNEKSGSESSCVDCSG